MSPEEICSALKTKFAEAVVATVMDACRPYAEVTPESWPSVAAFLRDERGFGFNFLRSITALDLLADDRLACVYDLFALPDVSASEVMGVRHVFAVRVCTDRNQPRIPTVAHLWAAADWHEREAYDMMGIVFDGHPHLERILCPEDWEGHPLRKDYAFPTEYHGVPGTTEYELTSPRHEWVEGRGEPRGNRRGRPRRCEVAMTNTIADTRIVEQGAPPQGDVCTEEMLVNMGPQHPSTHGVLRVVLRTDGELVLEAIPHIGYLHRCAEKIGENVAPYQYIPYTDRMDYLAGMNNNQAFALAVEKIAGLEVPKRAQYIRVIFAELNRIASHLVAVGTYGLDMGAFTAFLYCFREREMILDMFEAACGARLTYSYITVGGVTDDLPDGFVDRCSEFLDFFEPKIDDYNNLLSFNHIFVKRTAQVGVISAEDAIRFGLSGPVLRGSGIKFDLRRALPYEIYDQLDFDIPVGEPGGTGSVPRGVVVGDSWNRYYVRVLEMEQSVRIIRQCLRDLPDADPKEGVCHKKGKTVKLPADEVYLEIENPRGQLGFYVQGDGSAIPARVKVRGPSFCNLCALQHVTKNCLIADVPAILGSIDVVMGEVDR